MTNEELAVMVQSGDRDALLVLWEQVRRLVWKYANRWAVYGGNGVEAEDLLPVWTRRCLMMKTATHSVIWFQIRQQRRRSRPWTKLTGWSIYVPS